MRLRALPTLPVTAVLALAAVALAPIVTGEPAWAATPASVVIQAPAPGAVTGVVAVTVRAQPADPGELLERVTIGIRQTDPPPAGVASFEASYTASWPGFRRDPATVTLAWDTGAAAQQAGTRAQPSAAGTVNGRFRVTSEEVTVPTALGVPLPGRNTYAAPPVDVVVNNPPSVPTGVTARLEGAAPVVRRARRRRARPARLAGPPLRRRARRPARDGQGREPTRLRGRRRSRRGPARLPGRGRAAQPADGAPGRLRLPRRNLRRVGPEHPDARAHPRCGGCRPGGAGRRRCWAGRPPAPDAGPDHLGPARPGRPSRRDRHQAHRRPRVRADPPLPGRPAGGRQGRRPGGRRTGGAGAGGSAGPCVAGSVRRRRPPDGRVAAHLACWGRRILRPAAS